MCDTTGCHRQGETYVWIGFEKGGNIKNSLCGPCKRMLLQGDAAAIIEEVDV